MLVIPIGIRFESPAWCLRLFTNLALSLPVFLLALPWKVGPGHRWMVGLTKRQRGAPLLRIAAFVFLILPRGDGLQPAWMNAGENKELRKNINFQHQVESLNESLPGRMNLAMKIFFYTWGLAISQLVVFVVSAFFQARTVCSRKFLKAIADSWGAGVATNVLFKILLAEKTFEAPLSHFLAIFFGFASATE